jgi:thiamine biosynthesis lipoprotein
MSVVSSPTCVQHAGGAHHIESVMGTAVAFDIRDTAGNAGLDDAVAWLHHVDETFSTYRMDSPISRLGRGEITLEDVSDEVRSILFLCERLRAETNGAFDALAVPAPNGTNLDPSGVVKGWSIERAAEILERHGHTDFLINGGGDIAIRGTSAPDRPWRIGIRSPQDASAVAMTIDARGPYAVATSGSYERGAHIIDPFTGAPIAELASVTVIGPDLTFADAYATTVYVMGEVGLEWLVDKPGYEGCVITHEGDVRATNGWPRSAA